jgi:hypothetical protein
MLSTCPGVLSDAEYWALVMQRCEGDEQRLHRWLSAPAAAVGIERSWEQVLRKHSDTAAGSWWGRYWPPSMHRRRLLGMLATSIDALNRGLYT